jgi:flagellar biosynthesis/type III secretory pathway M-ring protein FliF/YscJ
LVTVLYDKKVPSDKLLAVKQAIIALLNVTENQMVFTPTIFTETTWQKMLSPEWLVPLFLALWLLMFLWGPLRSFFKRLNSALEDKRQLIEQTQKIEQEEEAEEMSEEDAEQEGEGGAGEEDLTEEEWPRWRSK